MRSYFNRYVYFVTEHPKVVLALIACLTIAMALGLPRFKLDASADSLTLEHDEDLTYYRQIAKSFQSGDFLIVTFRPKEDLFSDSSLKLLSDLKSDLSSIEGVSKINSMLNAPLLYSPKQNISDVVKKPRTLLTPGVDRTQAKQEFQTSPIYKNLILGPDGQTTALQLNLEVDSKYIELVQKRDSLRYKRDTEGLSEAESKTLQEVSDTFKDYRTQAEARSRARVEEVRQVVARYSDRAQIFVGGVTMIAADMITFIKSDLIVFGSAAILFMIFILAAIFRSPRFVVIPMLSCLLAVFIMLGLVSWLDWRLTVISSNFVALLLIISLAIIIHLVVRYREYAHENPDWTEKELVAATVRFMARPCLYTSLTTIVAFASLVVSDIRPVIDFGWMMTIGLCVGLIMAFLIMPALLVLLPREKLDAAASPTPTASTPLTVYFSRLVERYGNKIIALSLLCFVLSVWGISRLEVENRFIDYFHDSTEIHQGLSVIDKHLGGTIPLDIIISAEGIGANDTNAQETAQEDSAPTEDEKDSEYGDDPFAEANPDEDDAYAEEDPFAEDDAQAATQNSYWLTVAGLSRLKEIQDYLEAQPEIGKVQSLAILYEVARDLNGGINDFELAVMQRTLSDEVKDVLISPFIPAGNDTTRITLRIKDGYPGLKRKELVERIRLHLVDDLGYAPDSVRMTGLLVLYNNMLQSLFSSQIVTLGLVFLAITFMFLVLFRSVTIAVIAILPNALAALLVLGTMGLIGLPLDMMTITIAAITVGIGVDDTIHYIHRFQEEIKVDGDYIAAMHRSHASIGRAMFYTSVIIIFGFSIMTLSEFIPTIYFGLLTGYAMLVALLGALLVLPRLILLVKPFK